jgi:predicted TIM-barrel enzyme
MMKMESTGADHIVTTYTVTVNGDVRERHATCTCRWHRVAHIADGMHLASMIAEHLGPVVETRDHTR